MRATRSNEARILAIIIIAITAVVIASVKPVAKAIVDNKKDRRKYELENKKLQDKIKGRQSKSGSQNDA